MTSEKEADNSKISYQREFITKNSNVSKSVHKILNCMFILKLMLKDKSSMPAKNMELDLSIQDTVNCMFYTILYLLIFQE